MAWFKTKAERQIEAQMLRDEQMQVFEEQIAVLKARREDYANMAAEAEMNGDQETYDNAVGALIQLNENVSTITRFKANFDMMNIQNAITESMFAAISALDKMADNRGSTPNLRKIQRVNVKVKKYMRQVQVSSKAMARMVDTSNPSNKARSAEEIESVRSLIDAARSRKMGVSSPTVSGKANNALDLSAEIEAERNNKIV